MALAGRRVTVTDAATRIDVVDADGTYGRSVAVTNVGAAVIDLGGNGVTAGGGTRWLWGRRSASTCSRARCCTASRLRPRPSRSTSSRRVSE